MDEIYVACFPLDYNQMPCNTPIFLMIAHISGPNPIIESHQDVGCTRNIRQVNVTSFPNKRTQTIYR